MADLQMTLQREFARQANELRPIHMTRQFTCYAEGAVLVEFGRTRVVCTATVEEQVPSFLRGQGRGWVTAEYGMLPRSTHHRMKREAAVGKQSGRTQEIQRLIGRSLRAVVDLDALGERQIIVDCDVLQADGGTRTASISGAFVALHDAVMALMKQGKLSKNPILEAVAAVSVGMKDGHVLLDLDYQEDSQCDTDMNIVMTASGGLVEVQGTAEGAAFSRVHMNQMLDVAEHGIQTILQCQQRVLNASL